jgi:hypothetical protein
MSLDEGGPFHPSPVDGGAPRHRLKEASPKAGRRRTHANPPSLEAYCPYVDLSYVAPQAHEIINVAPQAHEIINVALHREYSPGIIFIFS